MSNPMPLYKSHKLVRAFRIGSIAPAKGTEPAPSYEERDGDGGMVLVPSSRALRCVRVNPKWFAKHEPKVGGYFFQYEDGYSSWSPAEAFEAGYTILPEEEQTTEDTGDEHGRSTSEHDAPQAEPGRGSVDRHGASGVHAAGSAAGEGAPKESSGVDSPDGPRAEPDVGDQEPGGAGSVTEGDLPEAGS